MAVGWIYTDVCCFSVVSMHGALSHNLTYFRSFSSVVVAGCMTRVGSCPSKPVSRGKQEDSIIKMPALQGQWERDVHLADYRRLSRFGESYAQDPSRRPRATWGQMCPKIGCRAQYAILKDAATVSCVPAVSEAA